MDYSESKMKYISIKHMHKKDFLKKSLDCLQSLSK